jgi:hypothetical protein
MDKDKRIRELEAEVEFLKSNPSAKFYKELATAIEGLTKKLKDEELDLIEDTYQKSVLILADKSERVFNGLKIGLESFAPSQEVKSPKVRGQKNESQISV